MSSLLPLGEVTDRLRILGQSYAGMRTIPVDRIVGSVDRSVDFDRYFKPRRKELRRGEAKVDLQSGSQCVR